MMVIDFNTNHYINSLLTLIIIPGTEDDSSCDSHSKWGKMGQSINHNRKLYAFVHATYFLMIFMLFVFI